MPERSPPPVSRERAPPTPERIGNRVLSLGKHVASAVAQELIVEPVSADRIFMLGADVVRDVLSGDENVDESASFLENVEMAFRRRHPSLPPLTQEAVAYILQFYID